MLVGIGLLLLVLGTAHFCTDHGSQMDLEGGYLGAVGTGAGPPPQGDCTDCLTWVEAHSKGEEFCNFTGQEDWNVTDSLQRDAPETWVLVIVGGSGGYATGDFDCIFFHSIEWRSDWSWLEDGEEDSGFAIDFEEL